MEFGNEGGERRRRWDSGGYREPFDSVGIFGRLPVRAECGPREPGQQVARATWGSLLGNDPARGPAPATLGTVARRSTATG